MFDDDDDDDDDDESLIRFINETNSSLIMNLLNIKSFQKSHQKKKLLP